MREESKNTFKFWIGEKCSWTTSHTPTHTHRTTNTHTNTETQTHLYTPKYTENTPPYAPSQLLLAYYKVSTH